MKRFFVFIMLLLILPMTAWADIPDESMRLTVYTSHKEEVYQPIIEEFERRTGVWVRVVSGGTTELLERIAAATDAPAAEVPLEPAAKTPAELTQFCRQTGAALPEGKLLLFGQVAYLVPQELPEIKGLRVLRAGLELGQTMKNRFEPAHAWALWLKGLENSVSLAADAPELGQYLSGNVLPSGLRGWTLVRVDGLSLGWAKGDGTQLKNHYPKALRRPV